MTGNNSKNKNNFSKWVNEVAGNVIETVKETSSVVAEKADVIGSEVKDFAEDAMVVIKDGSDKLSKQLHTAIIEADRKRLMPIFKEDLFCETFKYPSMIRVVEYDKLHMENEACLGAIGFMDLVNGAKVLNIYKANTDELNVHLHPNITESIFYLSPCTTNFYVDLDDYFNYQKKQRIDELNLIAFSLGAKYFKVAVMEEKKTFVSKSQKGSVNAKNSVSAKAKS